MAQSTTETTEVRYVGTRVRGGVRVLTYPGKQELTPSRSLDVVNHSPSGFEWGMEGAVPPNSPSRSCSTTHDPKVARAHYQAFRREVVSQLECTEPDEMDACGWEIEQWLPDD